ncbi:hypothetical protein [Nocardioides mangrovi]|uniref:Alpha/beta hydrolase n=1 Tax=Nocardioides mangrovi TaxID=2874580 RepID=A0ABS7UB64_9ACTN|nr:hypothetical protein [Nocardioides mangrovi]MBZ5738228.1 hypothetical protein [Nocardioides mangrovi]
MTRYVDLATDGTAVGRCIVLPGRQYTPDGPLLFFAAQVALARGWDVRQVWWEVPRFDDDADEVAWVAAELAAAVDGHDVRVLVVAKSLGTLCAAAAAEHGYAAAWLTPLLSEPDLAAPLLAYPAAQLVVIGSEDPYLDRDVLEALPGEQLVVPGDHVLRIPGDVSASVASHDRVVRAFDEWLEVRS